MERHRAALLREPFEDRYICGIIAGIVRNLYDRVCG